MDLENAVAHVARQTRLDELHLLAAILRISVRYGGRVDLLLERVAHFMRDREQAEQDLFAMTAETRMSAWVLSLLPVAVCCLIISFNAGYFLNMWNDASGRNIIWTAAALQVFGVLLLYRMAKLEEGAIDGDIPSLLMLSVAFLALAALVGAVLIAYAHQRRERSSQVVQDALSRSGAAAANAATVPSRPQICCARSMEMASCLRTGSIPRLARRWLRRKTAFC